MDVQKNPFKLSLPYFLKILSVLLTHTECQVALFSFWFLCFDEKSEGSTGSSKVLHTHKKLLENSPKYAPCASIPFSSIQALFCAFHMMCEQLQCYPLYFFFPCLLWKSVYRIFRGFFPFGFNREELHYLLESFSLLSVMLSLHLHVQLCAYRSLTN